MALGSSLTSFFFSDFCDFTDISGMDPGVVLNDHLAVFPRFPRFPRCVYHHLPSHTTHEGLIWSRALPNFAPKEPLGRLRDMTQTSVNPALLVVTQAPVSAESMPPAVGVTAAGGKGKGNIRMSIGVACKKHCRLCTNSRPILHTFTWWERCTR